MKQVDSVKTESIIHQNMDKTKIKKKLSVKIQADYSYGNLLELLTREELDYIKEDLNLKISNSSLKRELVELLVLEIPRNIQGIVSKLSNEELTMLGELIRNGGSIDFDESVMELVFSLRSKGLLFAGKIGERHRIIMPNEIMCLFKPLPRINSSKIGRNDKCTCGSGKKYKRCCGMN